MKERRVMRSMRRGIRMLVLFSLLLLLPACASTTFYEYGTYDNFTDYQSDFERITTLIQANGTGTYYISDSYGLSKDDTEIVMTEEEQESLRNIMIHSYGYTYNGSGFQYIDVTEDYTYFQYEGKGCGVMYTQDVKESIVQITHSDIKYGHLNLATDWYGIYR